MTTPLHDLLDDLGRSEQVSSPALAERAWADGRRRRRRSRVQGVVAAAAALLLLALVAPVLLDDAAVPRFARSGSAGVDGHPERIGHQWWVRDLPDRPGPVAAVLQAYGDEGVDDNGWYAVRADGHRWRLPGDAELQGWQVAGLSADGRLLARLAGVDGPYVVQDLVSGRRVEFPQIVAHRGSHRYAAAVQTPVHFSPGGRHVLLSNGGLVRPDGSYLLLDTEDGSLSVLPRPGVAAGWASDDRIVWLSVPPEGRGPEKAPVQAVTTDLSGQVLTTVGLAGTESVEVYQWTGAVHPDGGLLALVSDSSFGGGADVRRFLLQSGAALGPPLPVELEASCPSSWGPDGTLVVPVRPPSGVAAAHRVAKAQSARVTDDGATLFSEPPTTPFTVLAPRLGGSCLNWAYDAVGAPGRGGGLLATAQAGWTWWWKETLLAAVLTGAAGRLLLRRRRAAAARPAPPGIDWYS